MRLIYMAAHGRCNAGFTGCGVKSLNFYAAVKTGFFLPGDVYNRMLADLLQELEGLEPNNGSRPKLLLCGIVFDPLEIHRINSESGTLVVTTYANIWGRPVQQISCGAGCRDL